MKATKKATADIGNNAAREERQLASALSRNLNLKRKKEREEGGSRHKVVAACSVRPYRSSRSKVKQVFFVEYENT